MRTLVFDVKKHRFYLKDQSVRFALSDHFHVSCSPDPNKVMLKGNILYAFHPRSRRVDWRTPEQGLLRIATFRFEDGKISGGKTVYKSEDQKIVFDENVYVKCVCFV